MNAELRRVAAAIGLLGVLGFGVFCLARRLSGAGNSAAVRPASPDLRIARLEEAVHMAQQRRANAGTQADSALFKAKQAAIRVQEIETMLKQQAQKRAFEASKVRMREDIYPQVRDYDAQVAPILGPMGVSPADHATPAARDIIDAQRQQQEVEFATRQEEARLAEQYTAQVHDFNVALNDLQNAKREVEIADAEVRQNMRNLKIAETASLASSEH